MITNWKILYIDMYGDPIHTRFATNCTKEFAEKLSLAWIPSSREVQDIKVIKDECRTTTTQHS